MNKCPAFLFFLPILFIYSCIKEEPKNPEADIEAFVIDTSLLTSNVFIDQANSRILLYLKPEASQTGIAPVIAVSKGASVVPKSGDSIHFSAPVSYTVTSESGTNKKVYRIEVVQASDWSFNFENWQTHPTDQYEYPLGDDNAIVWSSGNPGVALSGIPKQTLAYPTHSTADGYLGTKAAELNTIKGTALSELIGIRLFAGSLFLGNFNGSVALASPLKATEFGQPYVGQPSRFTGYYKYTPGPNFQDEHGDIVAGRSDSCTLYAILYNGPDRLNGTNVNTSDKIIARAQLPDGSARSEFTRFDIPFTYVEGAEMGNNMMLAIVASSSSQGNLYKGAIGSKLVVDSLRIIRK